MADRQTHVHSAHLFSCSWPTTERRATERESQRKAALQQMVLLKELRWNSLCYKSSLVFFETPIGSGPPAGLRSNVLRPNECIDTHTHTHTPFPLRPFPLSSSSDCCIRTWLSFVFHIHAHTHINAQGGGLGQLKPQYRGAQRSSSWPIRAMSGLAGSGGGRCSPPLCWSGWVS